MLLLWLKMFNKKKIYCYYNMKKYFVIIIIIVLYLIFHCILNNFAQNSGELFYKNRIDNNKVTPKVYDIMHKYIPEIKDGEWLTNTIIVLSTIPLFKEYNYQLYFDFILLLFIVNFIRDITINLTILPKHKDCSLKNHSEIYKHIAGACYDKIFSGHFAFVFLLSSIYYNNSVITNLPFLIIWNLINAVLIISVRSHYTIDIWVAFLVCFIVFNQYSKLNLSINNVF